MTYPSEKADSLEMYVRRTFTLTSSAAHVYAGLRWLERDDRSGFCRTVIKGHRDIAKAVRVNKCTVNHALLELQEKGLIDLILGNSIRSKKEATSVRRRTLEEIKARFMVGDDVAHRLARELSKRSFIFNGKLVHPTWTPGHTGRISSSKPNVQGLKSKERLAGLLVRMKPGFVLVHSDIKQAEPSLIKHVLGISTTRDIYGEYMTATGCCRDDAKKVVNTLSYCKHSLACFGHWPMEAQVVLCDYVEALSDYKDKLYHESIKARAVTTLTGRTISAENRTKQTRLHRGVFLNWRIQGTVADVINTAAINLLEHADVLVPVHDALYVIIPPDKADIVEKLIQNEARKAGLSLSLHVIIYPVTQSPADVASTQAKRLPTKPQSQAERRSTPLRPSLGGIEYGKPYSLTGLNGDFAVRKTVQLNK